MCTPACYESVGTPGVQSTPAAPSVGTAFPRIPIVLWPWPWLEWIDAPIMLQLWWRVRHGIPLDSWRGCGCPLVTRRFYDRLVLALFGPELPIAP